MSITRRDALTIGAALAAGNFAWAAASGDGGQIGSAYLVRHAEKESEADDSPLSDAGRQRAARIARLLSQVSFQAAYATRYARTSATIQAVADANGLTIDTQAPPEKLVDSIETRHRGQRVLVAGHSNTIPPLLRRLAPDFKVPDLLPGHGDLFVVDLAWHGDECIARRVTVLNTDA